MKGGFHPREFKGGRCPEILIQPKNYNSHDLSAAGLHSTPIGPQYNSVTYSSGTHHAHPAPMASNVVPAWANTGGQTSNQNQAASAAQEQLQKVAAEKAASEKAKADLKEKNDQLITLLTNYYAKEYAKMSPQEKAEVDAKKAAELKKAADISDRMKARADYFKTPESIAADKAWRDDLNKRRDEEFKKEYAKNFADHMAKKLHGTPEQRAAINTKEQQKIDQHVANRIEVDIRNHKTLEVLSKSIEDIYKKGPAASAAFAGMLKDLLNAKAKEQIKYDNNRKAQDAKIAKAIQEAIAKCISPQEVAEKRAYYKAVEEGVERVEAQKYPILHAERQARNLRAQQEAQAQAQASAHTYAQQQQQIYAQQQATAYATATAADQAKKQAEQAEYAKAQAELEALLKKKADIELKQKALAEGEAQMAQLDKLIQQQEIDNAVASSLAEASVKALSEAVAKEQAEHRQKLAEETQRLIETSQKEAEDNLVVTMHVASQEPDIIDNILKIPGLVDLINDVIDIRENYILIAGTDEQKKLALTNILEQFRKEGVDVDNIPLDRNIMETAVRHVKITGSAIVDGVGSYFTIDPNDYTPHALAHEVSKPIAKGLSAYHIIKTYLEMYRHARADENIIAGVKATLGELEQNNAIEVNPLAESLSPLHELNHVELDLIGANELHD